MVEAVVTHVFSTRAICDRCGAMGPDLDFACIPPKPEPSASLAPASGEKTEEVTDRNLEMLIRDLRPYAKKPAGSLRIDMEDVRSILALYERSALEVLRDDAVGKAMEEAWDEICADTHCHPLDIEQLGRKRLTFSPGHWARLTAMRLRDSILSGKGEGK